MKFIILFFLCLITCRSFGVFKPHEIFKTWVLKEVRYNDGSELPDENVLKYNYLKYTFTAPNTVNTAFKYFELGNTKLFEIRNRKLIFKTTLGYDVNTMQVEALDENHLVLLESEWDSFDGPKLLKYYFVSEDAFQKSIILDDTHIYKITNRDKQNPKTYASFKGEGLRFSLGEGLSHKGEGYFLASFIVFKSGKVDNLKIIRGINKDFDEIFKKEFNRQKRMFVPAKIKGSAVNVQMFCEIRYFDAYKVIKSDELSKLANIHYQKKDYASALEIYNKALTYNQFDQENLYKRAICYKMLGNMNAACVDWNRIQELGGASSKVLLEKYCKR